MATSDYKGQFIKFFDTLSPEEQDELLILMESKRSDVEKYKDVGNYTICPQCGSTQTKKYGKTAKGTQRRLCKDCGKTWVEAEVNLSRLSETQKTALFMGMIQNLTISQLAERMNVCESTAYRYKMQVMDIIYLNTTAKLQEVDDHGKAKFRLEGDIQCDEFYIPVSFKGKRDPEFFIFGQRRFTRTHMTVAERVEYLHKHGLYDRVMKIPGFFEELQENAKSYRRGISNDQLCTVVAVDDDRNILAVPTNIGRMDKEDLGDLLTKHLDRRSTLITDSHSSYPPIAEAANARHVQIDSGQHTSGRYHLGAVNSIHSEIEKFMPETAERLPSTKYTAQYMAFFSWLQLRQFRTELTDIQISADMQVNVDGFLRFADYFFDGIFVDWTVLDHISRAKEQITSTREKIKQVLYRLNSMQKNLQQELDSETARRDTLILRVKM